MSSQSRSQRRRGAAELMNGTKALRIGHQQQSWWGARRAEFATLSAPQQTIAVRAVAQLAIATGFSKKEGGDTAPRSALDETCHIALYVAVKTCGQAAIEDFLTTFKASDRARKELPGALVNKAYNYAFAPSLPSSSPVENTTITLADVRRAEAAARFVPRPVTPHMLYAYQMGMASDELRVNPDEQAQALLESGRRLAVKSHWLHIFRLLAAKVRDLHSEALELRITRAVPYLERLNEAEAEYERVWFRKPVSAWDAEEQKWEKRMDCGSWARILDLTDDYNRAVDRCRQVQLRVNGIFFLLLKWWKQAPKSVKRHTKLTTAEKQAKSAAIIRQLKMNELTDKVIVPVKPVEEIFTLNIKNLPMANRATLPKLNEAIRKLVGSFGGMVRPGVGGVYIPLNGSSTKGFCFVECTTAANARHVLQQIGQSAVVLGFNGEESELRVTLALSNRKSKAEMEAEKAKAAAERSSSSVLTDAVRAAMRPNGTTLQPICIAAVKKQAADAVADALKAQIMAAYPTLSNSAAAPSKTFETSFASMAAKPLPEKIEAIDPFNVKLNGTAYAVAFAPNTALGKAQMALRQATEEALAKAVTKPKLVEKENTETHWIEEVAEEVAPIRRVAVMAEPKKADYFEDFKKRLAAAAKK